MPEPVVYFRGQFAPMDQARVSVTTHALHYGTAVFEGIRGNWNADKGKMFVFRMREHYERFLQGCRIMMLDIPYDVEELCDITVEAIVRCGYSEDVYIRPLAYKSQELVANLRLQDLESDFTLIIVPFGSYIETDGAIRCCTSSWRRIDDLAIPPRVKIAGHYVNSVLAKTEATLAGFDEAVMMNPDGTVSEGTGESLFLASGGRLYTPPVGDNNLTGITRDSAMRLAHDELGLDVSERHIRRSELYLADEVFLTGTAAHITPVGQLDNRPIGAGGVGPITEELRGLYATAIRGNNDKYMEWCTAIALESF